MRQEKIGGSIHVAKKARVIATAAYRYVKNFKTRSTTKKMEK